MIQRALVDLPGSCSEPTDPCYAYFTKIQLEALLIANRDEEAAEIALGLDPETAGWHSALLFAGIAAARTGDVPTAHALAAAMDKLTEADLANDITRLGDLIIGRAMISAQLGEIDESLDLIRLGLSRGTLRVRSDLGIHELQHNIFFEPLWDNHEFQEIMRPKG